MEKGLIHIYTGDGKGKTTCALGLALRASGRGKKVLWTSFLKDFDSGEFTAPPFDIVRGTPVEGFFFNMTKEKKEALRLEHEKRLVTCFDRAAKEDYFLLVLDEICPCVDMGIIDMSTLARLLKSKPEGLEVALTGRGASEEIIALADYVSEIKCVSHPFERGVGGREGIEY